MGNGSGPGLGGCWGKAAAPASPTLLGPAAGGALAGPFSISWAAVGDPAGIVAYNWEVSASPDFAELTRQNSTGGQTRVTVSGLADGTYFWRVQAVNGHFVQGAWSAARTFTVAGAHSGEPAEPALWRGLVEVFVDGSSVHAGTVASADVAGGTGGTVATVSK